MVLLTNERCLLLCKGSSEDTKKFLAMLYNEEETNVMAHNTYEVKFILQTFAKFASSSLCCALHPLCG